MADYAGKVVDLKDSNGDLAVAQEGETCEITGTFKDGDTAIAKAVLQTLTLTLYDEATVAVINSRSAQNILDANSGSVSDAGVLTLTLSPADNPVVSTLPAGHTESHIARVTWTWSDGGTTKTGIQELRLRVEKLASPS